VGRAESLRGFGAFHEILRTGGKLDGNLVNCSYLVEKGHVGTLRVGYSVPSRFHNAVRRNRLRRLMRASFSQCRQSLLKALEVHGVSLALIFHFKGRDEALLARLKIQPVLVDIQRLCERIIGRLGSRNS
jgi:ribonuclease P protein component